MFRKILIANRGEIGVRISARLPRAGCRQRGARQDDKLGAANECRVIC